MPFNPQMLIALAIALSSFFAGWWVNGQRADARVSALEADYANMLLEVEKTVSETLQAARAVEARGDMLMARQLALELENLQLGAERDEALRNTTVGRPCLGAGALRVLNNQRAVRGRGLPAPASGPPDPAAAVAANSGNIVGGYAATDVDVARWAGQAITQYNACRGRIETLREFYQ